MEQLLRQFNFSDKEILVYRTLLRLGSAKVSELADKTGILRTSCQEYLRSLEEKGFINHSKMGNRYYYKIEDPDNFRQKVNERLFTVDKIFEEFNKHKKHEVWRVRSMTNSDYANILKKIKKRGYYMEGHKDGTVEMALVDTEKAQSVLINSDNKETQAIEMVGSSLYEFHKDLLGPK